MEPKSIRCKSVCGRNGEERQVRVIGIQAHTQRPAALRVAQQAYEQVLSLGAVPVYESTTAEALGLQAQERPVEARIVIGGDGTILRGAARAAREGIPVAGVNLGRLGFLSEVEPGDLSEGIAALLEGRYTVEERMMLSGQLFEGDGRKKSSWTALNDFLIFKSNVSCLTEMEVAVNGQLVDRYCCDGVVIATPTGSTAYALSAGGPVMVPWAKGIVIAPICPHKLGQRPIVVGGEDVVEVRPALESSPCSISSDGQMDCALVNANETLRVQKSDLVTRLVHFKPYNFFDLMRQKLY